MKLVSIIFIPNRRLSYPKIAKGERRGKRKRNQLDFDFSVNRIINCCCLGLMKGESVNSPA